MVTHIRRLAVITMMIGYFYVILPLIDPIITSIELGRFLREQRNLHVYPRDLY